MPSTKFCTSLEQFEQTSTYTGTLQQGQRQRPMGQGTMTMGAPSPFKLYVSSLFSIYLTFLTVICG